MTSGRPTLPTFYLLTLRCLVPDCATFPSGIPIWQTFPGGYLLLFPFDSLLTHFYLRSVHHSCCSTTLCRFIVFSVGYPTFLHHNLPSRPWYDTIYQADLPTLLRLFPFLFYTYHFICYSGYDITDYDHSFLQPTLLVVVDFHCWICSTVVITTDVDLWFWLLLFPSDWLPDLFLWLIPVGGYSSCWLPFVDFPVHSLNHTHCSRTTDCWCAEPTFTFTRGWTTTFPRSALFLHWCSVHSLPPPPAWFDIIYGVPHTTYSHFCGCHLTTTRCCTLRYRLILPYSGHSIWFVVGRTVLIYFYGFYVLPVPHVLHCSTFVPFCRFHTPPHILPTSLLFISTVCYFTLLPLPHFVHTFFYRSIPIQLFPILFPRPSYSLVPHWWVFTLQSHYTYTRWPAHCIVTFTQFLPFCSETVTMEFIWLLLLIVW